MSYVDQMSTESPPAKRPRTHEAPGGEVLQSSRFWFYDGNIVLQAENTQYRVHGSMLSLHSKVFKDMFDVPQPHEPSEPCIEGCPLISLTDKAEDLEEVLSIFYDNIRTNDMRKLTPFRRLAAILRLGKKYEIDYLRDEGLQRLRLKFPSSLDLWDESYYDCLYTVSETLRYDAINLAHELSIQTILPALYAAVVKDYNAEDILSGLTANEKRIYLNEDALKHCLIGRDNVLIFVQEHLRDWVGRTDIIPAPDCHSTEACQPQKSDVILRLRAFDSSYGTIEIFNPAPALGPKFQKICPVCTKSVEQAYKDLRQELWQSLPSYFGLPKWKDLKDFDQ
ncbi:hypothetical protein GALMADRAFT_257854 [Galerina marginata CBS 339.88]|uniref:BTB domain-containing protein n=1 Tax=Galerina marginata (strain CBS 339.88) TaxID=685588 RepID=A0A067S9P7_GALM3|nr:hypothetical protein GALMADRAFT_257854 [Galerina marginata CBS 339.88]